MCYSEKSQRMCLHSYCFNYNRIFVELFQLFAPFIQWQFIEDEEKFPYTSPVSH